MNRPSASHSRHFRLTSKADFQSVFDKPSKVTRKGLMVLYRQTERPHPRLGIIVSKQHVRRAVDRNRLRRVVRESFRQVRTSFAGLDIVVLIRPEWAALTAAKSRLELASLWQLISEKSRCT